MNAYDGNMNAYFDCVDSYRGDMNTYCFSMNERISYKINCHSKMNIAINYGKHAPRHVHATRRYVFLERRKSMAKVKRGIFNLDIPNKIVKADAVISQMTANANFPTPNPSIADITAKNTALKNAQTATEALRQASQAQTLVMNQTEDELDNMLNSLAGYIDSVSAGDEGMILSSGFDVADTPGTNVVPLYVVSGFAATTGDEPGEVNCMWNKLVNVGKHSYNVYGRVYGSADTFTLLAGTDQSKADIKDLTPATKYEFYVVGVKKNQPGPQSDISVAKSGENP